MTKNAESAVKLQQTVQMLHFASEQAINDDMLAYFGYAHDLHRRLHVIAAAMEAKHAALITLCKEEADQLWPSECRAIRHDRTPTIVRWLDVGVAR